VIISVYIFEIVLFTAVILPNFCCDLTRIYLDYFWQNLIGFFLQNHVCRQSTAQGLPEDLEDRAALQAKTLDRTVIAERNVVRSDIMVPPLDSIHDII